MRNPLLVIIGNDGEWRDVEGKGRRDGGRKTGSGGGDLEGAVVRARNHGESTLHGC